MCRKFDITSAHFLVWLLAGFVACIILISLLLAHSLYQAKTALVLNPAQTSGPQHISASEYLVANLDAGTSTNTGTSSSVLLVSKHPEEGRSIASLTKLMTALIATQDLDIAKKTTISPQAAATYPEDDFQTGDQWVISDLFYPLLMDSSNDAAQALSEAYPQGPAAFVTLMNKEAVLLDMRSTRFADPTGLSDADISSADDLLKLVVYIEKNDPAIFSLTKVKDKTIKTAFGMHNFTNMNIFSDDPSFVGGKTGYTPAAGETMIALFQNKATAKPSANSTVTDSASVTDVTAIIVLGSQDREQDVSKLLVWERQNP